MSLSSSPMQPYAYPHTSPVSVQWWKNEDDPWSPVSIRNQSGLDNHRYGGRKEGRHNTSRSGGSYNGSVGGVGGGPHHARRDSGLVSPHMTNGNRYSPHMVENKNSTNEPISATARMVSIPPTINKASIYVTHSSLNNISTRAAMTNSRNVPTDYNLPYTEQQQEDQAAAEGSGSGSGSGSRSGSSSGYSHYVPQLPKHSITSTTIGGDYIRNGDNNIIGGSDRDHPSHLGSGTTKVISASASASASISGTVAGSGWM